LLAVGGRVREAASSATAAGVHQQVYLGIDGGGSHTVALLARAEPGSGWEIIGRGLGGPSNPQRVGLANAQVSLEQAIHRAFAAADLPRGRVSAACLGMAGVGRAEDRQAILTWTTDQALAEHIEVRSDVELLLPAGTPEGWGVALVAGTGSIAHGRTADGRTARDGGWGYLLGDEGSAYALALAGLQAVARAADGRGPATALTSRLLARLNVKEPAGLVAAVYRGGLDRAALASLAPVILEAGANDEIAATLIGQAAESLACLAATVARALSLTETPLALAGGLLLENPGYQKRVLEALTRLGIRTDPVGVVLEPAQGALRLALGAALPPVA
jgi:N-acetylglucosamine kinase-like BadF-type ATPase